MDKQQSMISCTTHNNLFHHDQLQRKQQHITTKNNKNNNNKKFKRKTKPIKVVYISNPMKVKTSVSEFRSLVQQLTGRDSELGTDDDVDDDNNDLLSMGQYHSRYPAVSNIVPDPVHHQHTTMKQEVPAVLVAAAKNDDLVVGKASGRVQEVPAVVAGQLLNDDAYCFQSVTSPQPPTTSVAALMNDDYEYGQQYYYFDQDGFVPQMMMDNNFNGFLPSSTTTSSYDLFSLHEQLVVTPAPAL